MMTKEELAAKLNGREYGNVLMQGEARAAGQAGLIIIMGQSDDITSFDGALDDEAGAYYGAEHLILPGPFLLNEGDDFDADAARQRGWVPPPADLGVRVSAQWCPHEFPGSWLITTDAPHACFDIMEDGELYCRGIVIDAPVEPK
jgi:hypothetical protein